MRGIDDSKIKEQLKEPKPKKLREVPAYIKKVVSSTSRRLFYIVHLVWSAKPSLLVVMLFMTVYNGVMPLIGTLITANLLKEVVRSFTETVDLIPPLALSFGYTFVNYLFSSLDSIITKLSGEVVTNHVKLQIMSKAREVDLASFDMPDFYSRLENATREAGTRPVSILSSTFGLISKLISMVSYIVILAALLKSLNWSAYLFFALFVTLSLLSAVVSFSFRKKSFNYMRKNSKVRRQLNYYGDIITNKDFVKEIRLFDLSDLFIGRYKDVFQQYFSGIRSLIWREGGWNIFLSVCTAVVNAALFWMVAVNVRRIDDYSVYTGALNAISACVASFISTIATIYEGSLFIDNMIVFMDEKNTIVPLLDKPLTPQHHCGHTIELRNVSFVYPGTSRYVLKNVNLTLKAGETVALVGLNGSGKTTLIKLITRLYDPTEGEILLDGKDIRKYDVKELYKLYGIIFQDYGKYAVSVRENIWFGQIHQSEDNKAISNAAIRSNASDFIGKLPNQYDTPLMRYFEENGIELSVGQWQKLSVARAFYSDADIFILDEPTASLDALAEQEIFDQFDHLRKDKTTIFVSHRLSSATTADKVVVLKDGAICEYGTHSELMEKKGDYYELFSTQAKRYAATANAL